MNTNILLVDDNPGLIQVMGRVLSGLGQLRFATSGAGALRQMREAAPDLVLLDAEMPGMTGFQVCEEMQSDPHLQGIPVIFVTGHSGPEFELKGLELGAVDFIAKPISEPLLMARAKTQLRIKRLTDELRAVATTDALTAVPNRRVFDEALAREWRSGLRAGEPIGLLMVDVDHFKKFNDHYGHPAGDTCLHAVAQALRSVALRPADLVARYGGEEFAVLLPKTPRAGAQTMARRLLQAIQHLQMPHAASPTSRFVSVSIGVGCYDAQTLSWTEPSAGSRLHPGPQHRADDLLRSADQALYAAKARGRARACWLDIDDANAPAQAGDVLSEDVAEFSLGSA